MGTREKKQSLRGYFSHALWKHLQLAAICFSHTLWRHGYESKLNHQGTAGFSLCFDLPGFYFGYLFLTHTHMGILDCLKWAEAPHPFAALAVRRFAVGRSSEEGCEEGWSSCRERLAEELHTQTELRTGSLDQFTGLAFFLPVYFGWLSLGGRGGGSPFFLWDPEL